MKSSQKDLTLATKTDSRPQNILIKKIFYLFLILVITFVVYNPARNAKLTNWDDDKYITNNVDITSFKKHKSNLLTKTYESNYHPLTMLSYAYDYSIGKLNPKVYHRTNILIHLANAALVFWLIILITGNLEIGLICGMLFGIHPLHVESVAWVSERKNVLYTLFFLFSLIAYIKYLKAESLKFYSLALFLFILSLLSKGMAVSLTVTLIAIDYLFDRKLLSKKVLLEKIPFLALSIVFGLIAIYAQPLKEIDPFRASPLNNPFYEKLLYATYNIGEYVTKLFAPFKLAVFYPYPEKENGVLPLQYYILPFLILAFLLTSFILLVKSKKYYSKFILFGFLFFIINIALVLQLLPVGDAIRADRYAYIPSIGIFILIGLAYKYIGENKIAFRNIFVAVLVVYGTWLSYLTYGRCEVWHDSISLWTDEIKKYPKLGFVYNQRGLAKDELKNLDGALEDYNKCIQADPYFYKAYNNKAIIESGKGDYKTAIKDYDKALSINKNYAAGYKNRAQTKYISGDYKGAIKDYSSYLEFSPGEHKIYLARALAKSMLQDYSSALNDYNKAAELAPDDVEAYCNRGIVKSILQDYKGAMSDLTKAIEIAPSSSAAYYNRARVKFLTGLNNEACSDMQKAAQYGHAQAAKEFSEYCK